MARLVPPEIWRTVFELGTRAQSAVLAADAFAEDQRHPRIECLDFPVTVSQVSSTWRQIAIQAQVIWSCLLIPSLDISDGQKERISDRITRSGEVDLDIVVFGQFEDPDAIPSNFWDALSLLKSVSHRWRTVTILVGFGERHCRAVIEHFMSDIPLHRLLSFSLQLYCTLTTRNLITIREVHGAVAQLPSPMWKACPLRLTKLTLVNTGVSMSDLLSHLHAVAPEMVELVLNEVVLSTVGPARESLFALTFPKLRVLSLSSPCLRFPLGTYSHECQATDLLQYIDAPFIEILEIRRHVISTGQMQFSEFLLSKQFCNRCCHVRALSIGTILFDSADGLNRFYSVFEKVQKVDIDTSGYMNNGEFISLLNTEDTPVPLCTNLVELTLRCPQRLFRTTDDALYKNKMTRDLFRLYNVAKSRARAGYPLRRLRLDRSYLAVSEEVKEQFLNLGLKFEEAGDRLL